MTFNDGACHPFVIGKKPAVTGSLSKPFKSHHTTLKGIIPFLDRKEIETISILFNSLHLKCHFVDICHCVLVFPSLLPHHLRQDPSPRHQPTGNQGMQTWSTECTS